MSEQNFERRDLHATAAAKETDPVGTLLARMREGDRVAAAQFMDRFGQRIRRRVRGRLRPAVRRLFDSQEIISTLTRRLDAFVKGGKLAAETEGQLWALVFTMTENAVIDKGRLFDRLSTLEHSDELAHMLNRRLTDAERGREDGSTIELTRAFSALEDRTDREILSLWLNDTPHILTARLIGLSPAAVRKRWEVIKKRLHPVLSRE